MLTGTQELPDILPAFCKARFLVLGVGNILFGDDGFGPAVVEKLLHDYQIPDDIYVMDTGTGVRKLLFNLTLGEANPEEILVVDAVDWGQEIGQLSEISVSELPSTKIDDFSLHHVPTTNLLHDLEEIHGVRATVLVCDVGLIPMLIRPGLSPIVQLSVTAATQQIADRLSLIPITIGDGCLQELDQGP